MEEDKISGEKILLFPLLPPSLPIQIKAALGLYSWGRKLLWTDKQAEKQNTKAPLMSIFMEFRKERANSNSAVQYRSLFSEAS